jgi:O-methyltransferase
MKTYPVRRIGKLRKFIRSIFRRCTDGFNKHSEFYVAAKPDFHTGWHRIAGFNNLYADWISKNGRIDRGDLARFFFIYLQVEALLEKKIVGAFAEVGVFRGTTARLFRSLALERTLFIFDTFEGFTAEDVRQEHTKKKPPAGGWKVSLEDIKAFVGEENTHFIKGRFPDTAGEVPAGTRFALVHLDTDLYAPQIAGMKFFYPLMNRGGVMIIHDCNSAWTGSRRALDEFFADKPEHPVYMPDKSGSAVIIKS